MWGGGVLLRLLQQLWHCCLFLSFRPLCVRVIIALPHPLQLLRWRPVLRGCGCDCAACVGAGEVRPLLLANECTKLLGGTPPQCLLNNATAVQELKSRLQHLATVDDEGGVWMEVAITALPVASQPAAAAGQAGEQQQQSQEQEEDQPPVSGQQEGLLEAQQGATEGDGNEGQEQQQQLVVVHTGQAQQQQQPVFVIHDAVVPQPGDELQHEGQQDAAWLPQQQQPQEEGTAASEQLDEQQQQRQQAEAEAGENQPGTHNAQPPSEPAAAGRPKKRQRRRRGG